MFVECFKYILNHIIFLVLNCFDLDPTQAASSFIFDQDNFIISPEVFPVVIREFLNPAVSLKIVFSLNENSGFDMVSLNSIDHIKHISIYLFVM